MEAFCSLSEPFWVPQTIQNPRKSASEKQSFFDVVFFYHFLVDLGSILDAKKSSIFQKIELRRRPLKQRRFRGAFWVDLGVSGGRISSTWEPQWDQNRSKNDSEAMIRDWKHMS